MNDVNKLIRESLQGGDPTGWFEALYVNAAGDEGRVPWARQAPDPMLSRWLEDNSGAGKTALVVGCGLGDDAEALAAYGYNVTAFDISETAVAWCKRRFPESFVNYVVADLLQLPQTWQHAFDLVLESRTLQALPWDLTDKAIAAISGCVAPGGRVLVLCLGRDAEEDRRGIPWPLSRQELAAFGENGLVEQRFEDVRENGSRRFFIEYVRSS